MNKSVPLTIVCALLCLLSVGCGGGGSSSSSSGGNGGGATPSGLQFTSPTTPQTFEVGQTNPTIFMKVSQPVNWSLQSGCLHGMPAGTITNQTSTTATYNGPPQAVSTTCPSNPTDIVVATSQADATQSTTLTVIIVQTAPSISGGIGFSYVGTGTDGCMAGVPCCPQAGTLVTSNGQPVGTQVTQVLTASGGIPPYTWQVLKGALPTGLSLNSGADSTTMRILGTPVSPGCSTVQLQVTDARGVTSTPTGGQPDTLYVVTTPAALKIQVPSYPIAYNQTVLPSDPGVPYIPTALVAAGGVAPYAWVPDSTLIPPPNLALTSPSTNSGVLVLSGTPTSGAETGPAGGTPGQYPTRVQVSDSQQPYPAFGNVTLGNMGDAPLTQFCSAAPALPPTMTNGGNISANPVSGDSFLQGTFAFLIRGSDANGPVVFAGSVVLDGLGNVTGGLEDVTRSSGSQTFTIDPTHSNYTVGLNQSRPIGNGGSIGVYNRGCMTLANTGGGTVTLAFSLSGCSSSFSESGVIASYRDACGMSQNNGTNVAAGTFTSGRVIEFDDNTGSGTRATGILRMQDTSSFAGGVGGRYAFGLAGWDANKSHYAMAGSVQASTGNFSSAAADIDDAGTLSSQLTGGSGTYTLGANGRGTGTLKVGQVSFDLAFYMISKNEMFVLTTDPLTASQPVLGGEAVATASSFSSNSLQNTQIFHIGGLSSSGPDVSIGLLNFDGIGGFTGTLYEDQAGTIGTAALSGAYSVDPTTGRAPFTAPVMGQNAGPHPFVAYLVPPVPGLTRAACSQPANCIAGFLVGIDDTAQDGVLEFQIPTTAPPPPFSNRYVIGDYVFGNDENLDPPALPNMTPNVTGSVFASVSSTASTSGTLGGSSQTPPFFQDVSYGDPNYCQLAGKKLGPQPCLLLLPGQALSGSYSIATNGTGTFGGGTVSVTNGNVIFYIDESPLNLHPSIIVAEQ